MIGSNGSVIPLFMKQIAEGGPVTITHPEVVRYFMTVQEAVSLVLQAGAYAIGGEIFVLETGSPIKITDLANELIRLSGMVPGKDIELKITGLRPGEKLYEESLMTEDGLRATANKLIYVSKPNEPEEEVLINQLKALEAFIEEEPDSDELKEKLKEIVPSYQP